MLIKSVILLAFAHSCEVMAATPMTVMIDPGHGGRDKGATRRHVHESNITLKVGLMLHAMLKNDRSFRPILTRSTDRTVSLTERARAAKEHNADVLLSIHVNASPDPRAKGAEFYFQNQLHADDESLYLAHQENFLESGNSSDVPTYPFLDQNSYPPDVSSIVFDLLSGHRVWRSSKLAKSLKMRWRGTRKGRNNSVRQAPFFVLSQVTTPSSLVELGFLSNSEDFVDLTDDQKLLKMAQDLHQGLIAYKESVDKAIVSP